MATLVLYISDEELRERLATVESAGQDYEPGSEYERIGIIRDFGSVVVEERQYAILLDVQTDWPEVVFVGTHEECNEHLLMVVSPLVENNGDEAVYYETTAVISTADALAGLRERQDES